jgi:hypothetical protein
MIIRRHHATLLELLISMALTMVILSALSYFYRQVNFVNIEMDRAQNESFRKRYAENRLANILPRAISSTEKSGDFLFFSSPNLGGLFKENSPSLVFTFDNGVKLNKDLSYHVIGRLYLDKKGNLTLAAWPPKKRWKENDLPPMCKEILLEDVEELKFFYFVPPDRGKTRVDEKKQKAELLPAVREWWPEEWMKEYRQLPAIVKIVVKLKNEETVTFAFPLPHMRQSITYDG